MAAAIHAAAVAGVDPGRATREAVADRLTATRPPYWIVASGKASAVMADAAVAALAHAGAEPAGGVIVSQVEGPAPHPSLDPVAGDHPVPGERSARAAAALGDVVARARSTGAGTALVLLSGGTTSLIAAPADGVGSGELARLFEGLLASGADITAMNAVRRRFTRWGGGRLARALAPLPIHCLIVSDVVGDDLTAIGSGPCTPDPLTRADVRALIAREGLEPFVPAPLRDLLAGDAGAFPETPKPGDAAFDSVETEIILGNRQALRTAAQTARSLRLAPVKVVDEPLVDDATFTAQRIVDELVRFREGGLLDGETAGPLGCMIWGGETTVRLGPGTVEPGGRCQELALAAADALRAEGDRGRGITLLAAGTDGRDGPTDAAGAIVDDTTWDAIRAAGRDPADDLLAHRSYAALDAVGALVRTGLSGTNVGDVVVGIVERARG